MKIVGVKQCSDFYEKSRKVKSGTSIHMSGSVHMSVSVPINEFLAKYSWKFVHMDRICLFSKMGDTEFERVGFFLTFYYQRCGKGFTLVHMNRFRVMLFLAKFRSYGRISALQRVKISVHIWPFLFIYERILNPFIWTGVPGVVRKGLKIIWVKNNYSRTQKSDRLSI